MLLRGFGVARFWIFEDPCSSLTLPMFGTETRHCFERSFPVGVWNGFLLGKVRKENVPCRFCGGPDGDGHLFWECSYPPLVAVRESPEFHGIVNLDKAGWPRCLLWHGWLPALS